MFYAIWLVCMRLGGDYMAIISSITHHGRQTPDQAALVVADGATLSYRELDCAVRSLSERLIELGVKPADTVAIAMRDGSAMALAFLAVSSIGAAAPLNPNYRLAEFTFEIDDLDIAVMLVEGGDAEVSHAVEAAAGRQVPVLRLVANPDLPGGFAVEGRVPGEPAVDVEPPEGDAVALVLHTSGTTARPKIVPLTHRNLLASAQAIADTLSLEANDRGCCVMPLFHIHGLMAGLCASLVAGSTVITTPGFSAPDMGRWLKTHSASWYTAVPTMHQALLDRRRFDPQEFTGVDLRFIRSSSASLAPTVMAELEAEFGCPVVEAYGMTEAAHQMTSNPLPPLERKPGSVGPPAGPEVVVMGDDGAILGTDAIGEVVIQGPNVMAAYRPTESLSDDSFDNGWFRTGDQGTIDANGYLFLTGRLKEIINRGGENVSPREVDEVLLEHPGVAQAVTFSVPDRRLGEQVAAAVVTAAGVEASERELREHVAQRLAPYKVPRRVVFLDAIPKGPSGKLRRIGLAADLGLNELDHDETTRPFVSPDSAAQVLVAELWGDVLGRNGFGIWDHFLDLGGDSLAATRLLTRIRDEVDVEISMLDFFDAPTIAEQAALVEQVLLAGDGRPDAGAVEGAAS